MFLDCELVRSLEPSQYQYLNRTEMQKRDFSRISIKFSSRFHEQHRFLTMHTICNNIILFFFSYAIRAGRWSCIKLIFFYYISINSLSLPSGPEQDSFLLYKKKSPSTYIHMSCIHTIHFQPVRWTSFNIELAHIAGCVYIEAVKSINTMRKSGSISFATCILFFPVV